MLKNIANMVLNTPLLVTPTYAQTVLAVLGNRIGIDAAGLQVTGDKAEADDPRLDDGVMIIPIIGSISHRPIAINAMSGMTSYVELQAIVEQAVEDTSVSSILFDIASPGGSVAGAFDFRDYLMSVRGKKPMVSIARDSAASAAYLIASATDRVYTTQTGMVGSIGVVAAHIDKSEQFKMEGVKPTFIYAGSHKIDGNSANPLPAGVKKEFQAEVDASYDLFVRAVAESRKMDEAAVRATEARIFIGQDGVDAGLADSVATFDAILGSLGDDRPGIFQSAAIKQGMTSMNEDELRAEGAASERERIKAITSGAESEGRGTLATHLAFSTDMSADAAIGILANSPKEAVAAVAAPVAPEASADMEALVAENAALKAAAEATKVVQLASLESATGNVPADVTAGVEHQSAEDTRIAEARANARAVYGSKARRA